MLNRQELRKLIGAGRLIEGFMDLETQLTPNGFDLTVEKIFTFEAAGALDFSNKERKIPEGKEVSPQKNNPQDKFGWWQLAQGAYKIKTNETINLPDNLIALAFSRTSLLRMGAATHHGVWDAGFKGKGEFLLCVENPAGIKIKQNARLAQLVFLSINQTDQGYQGVYRNLK